MSEKFKSEDKFLESAINKVYGLILKAFEDFSGSKGEELDMESLIRICIMCNCPSRETAEMTLYQIVKDDFLEWRKDESGRVLFKMKDRANN